MIKTKKIILTFILMFSLIVNIDALTIKEDSSSYTGDVYVFGSTKFDNNSVITFSAAGIAGMNEAKVQLATNGEIDTENVKTYYFSDLTKSWNEISLDTGKLTVLTDEESSELEENLNVFYVNNVEKTVEVDFAGLVDEGSLKPNSPYATSEAKVEVGKILVPATWISGFTFTTNNTLVTVDLSKIETKEDTKENETKEIEPLVKVYPTLDLINNEGTTVKRGEDVTLIANFASNSYGGVKGTAKVTTTGAEGSLTADYNKKVTINDNQEDIVLNFSNLGIYTVKYEVTLENGILLTKSETFKVVDNGELSLPDIYSLNYAYDNNTLIVNDTINYVFNSEKNGYLVNLTILAPEKFDATSSKIKYDGIELPLNGTKPSEKWQCADMSCNGYLYWLDNVEFTDLNTTHTIEVEWYEGYTEKFTVKLGENATLNSTVNVSSESEFRIAVNVKNISYINVTSNFDITETYIEFGVNRDLTIDLNGNTITSKIENDKIPAIFIFDNKSNGSTLTFKNGKLSRPTASYASVLQVGDMGTDINKAVDFKGTKVVLADDFTIEALWFGVLVLGSNINLDVYGTITTDGAFAISGNYSRGYLQNPTVNIYEGAKLTSTSDTAIYMPSYMTVNIYGGEITGKGGIGIKLGNLNIKGGTITATGDLTSDSALKKTSDGFNPTGDAIYVEINDTYYTHYQTNNNTSDQVVNITISDDATLSSTNGNIIREFNLTDNKLVYDVDLTKVFADREEVITYNDIEANLTVNGIKYTSKDMQRAIDEAGEDVYVKLLTDITLDDLLILGGL